MLVLQKGCCFLGLLVSLSSTVSFSQEVIISGKVRDSNTYREIPAVNIFVKGTVVGTTSDISGRYSLRIPETLLKPPPKWDVFSGRYGVWVSESSSRLTVIFRHVSYEQRELSVDSLKNIFMVDLQPRVIPLDRVEIEESAVQPLKIEKDLPQTISVIEAKNFEIRGYVDAGDLLRTDHSVQVDEQLSGKKTATLRGGNADDILVLYNGVKLNNTFDNIFDLSLIDLEDIQRFEVIKGSNTALYGPEAFSGVINVVPKVQQNYTIRFQQRLGTYRSGNWGLHLYKKLGRLISSYSLKRGGSKRKFLMSPEDAPATGVNVDNRSLHHTANLNYLLSKDENGNPTSSLEGMWIYTDLDYKNQFDSDTLANFNHLLSLKFTGNLFAIQNVELFVAYKQLSEDRKLLEPNDAQPPSAWPTVNRDIDDRSLSLNAQKEFKFTSLDLLFAYQFEHGELDYLNLRQNIPDELNEGLQSADLQRQHHGVASILKYHGETGSEFLNTIDLDVSLRHDRVQDEQSNAVLRSGSADESGLFGNNNWNETMFKTAIAINGYRNDMLFNGYLTFGRNTKFPTLFQQINSPLSTTSAATQPNLSPEKNGSFEIGVSVTRDVSGTTSIYGWQIAGSYFQNHYNNKFRMFTIPGRPDAFYDNVKTARISGFEAKSSIFLFRKKLTVDFGVSKYFLSEKAAFPFKSDFKRVMNLNIDHSGYSFQVHWFKESEQVAWLRRSGSDPNLISDAFAESTLPATTNVDVHLGKTFAIGKFKLFLNASGRNLLNDDVVLEGLAIRDRRFYLTMGAQY